jgi:plastocyanin
MLAPPMGRTELARGLSLLAAGGALLVGASGCGVGGGEPDLVAGKQLFVERCGSCHILGRADTQGLQGPSLDAAFERALADGMSREGVEGVVRNQIGYPADLPPDDPAYMPADLVEGKQASDVAAYVASVVARGGEDTGLLAEAVEAAGEGEPAVADGGVLEIPADPGGQLVYVTSQASADPGALQITSDNESTVPHNIALEGGGVDEVGEVVQQGGVSTIDVDVEAGDYTFYCSVAGHREAGMEGTLTVGG